MVQIPEHVVFVKTMDFIIDESSAIRSGDFTIDKSSAIRSEDITSLSYHDQICDAHLQVYRSHHLKSHGF